MSLTLDTNRQDLEKALANLESISLDLSGVLDKSYIDTMDSVVNEYVYKI